MTNTAPECKHETQGFNSCNIVCMFIQLQCSQEMVQQSVSYPAETEFDRHCYKA